MKSVNERRDPRTRTAGAPGIIRQADPSNEAAGSGYPKEPTWNWVFRPLGYEIDSDSDGAEKNHTTEPVLGATPTRIINPFDLELKESESERRSTGSKLML